MNIKEAKQEILHTVAAYLRKDEFGEYVIPEIRQRPVLLFGPPGVGKTQIIEQIVELRTPMRLNGFINGKTVTITRDN